MPIKEEDMTRDPFVSFLNLVCLVGVTRGKALISHDDEHFSDSLSCLPLISLEERARSAKAAHPIPSPPYPLPPPLSWVTSTLHLNASVTAYHVTHSFMYVLHIQGCLQRWFCLPSGLRDLSKSKRWPRRVSVARMPSG